MTGCTCWASGVVKIGSFVRKVGWFGIADKIFAEESVRLDDCFVGTEADVETSGRLLEARNVNTYYFRWSPQYKHI